MAHFFKKHTHTASSPDTEELEMLRQKVGTLEEVVRRAEEDLREERKTLSMLQLKTTQWKEKVKELYSKDQVRIAQLEDELKVIKALHDTAPVPITAEMQSLLDKALSTLRDEHERGLGAKQQELNKALATVSDRELELAKSHREMKALQDQYIVSQQHFTHELELLNRHHEKEIQQLNAQVEASDKTQELRSHIRKQEKEIQDLEQHSAQQAVLTGELQTEIVELTETNTKLQRELEEAIANMSTVLEKQRLWKEGVKNIKLQDMKIIHDLQEELEKQKQAISTEKVKEEKLQSVEKNKDISQDLHNSQKQTPEGINLIHTVTDPLPENLSNLSHCKEHTNKYQTSLIETPPAPPHTLSTNSIASSPMQTKNGEANINKAALAVNLRAQLEEAVRQREEVQQELVRTGEELSSLREQGGRILQTCVPSWKRPCGSARRCSRSWCERVRS
ncbi:putative MYH7B protein [Trypanosoma rangeli]|uniref:Putative MYH7B protein n=1 Tax=Trypanosoma rangeli TaxID=5698 RepID=A0A3R7L255_TRYRA|nr:putative MYH7B protein [Trypanosoma rangeli]RNF06090.1 putative MYH7B protein [Trypanosoma rangeli]|eukprot:RNF06090.1 putative MYH7B protein [Trypanosoma rangeli]